MRPQDHAEPWVAVVIPAYQAATTIGTVIFRTRLTLPNAQVIVIDDGSTDGTLDAAKQSVLRHRSNLGKGAALRTGIEAALANGADLIVTVDADGQHAPEEIPRLLAPLVAREADLVLGSRARREPMPLGRRFTNWLSARLTTRIGGPHVPDAQTGFRAASREVPDGIRPCGGRYASEIAFPLDAVRAR